MKEIIPLGVRDYLPEDFKKRQSTLQKAIQLFEHKGYEPVATPLFEYWSSIEPLCSQALKERVIKFINPKGELLAIRPDHTIAIARLASTRLKEGDNSFKFYYSDPIYRLDPSTGESEQFQLGVENIGNSGVAHEASLIETCIKTLESLGLSEITIELNHTDTINNFSKSEQLALKKREYTGLKKYPKREALEKIEDSNPLSNLKNELQKKDLLSYITYNESIQTTTEYYNGFFFEACIKNCGKSVGRGGRYDKLLTAFDHPKSAIGFGLNYSVIEGLLS